MTSVAPAAPLLRPDRFYIGGEWAEPSTDSMIDVIDSGTEDLFFRVAEAQAGDISRAVSAARTAFDEGPWPQLSHKERAEYLRAFGPLLQARADTLAQLWPRESGTIHAVAKYAAMGMTKDFDAYAALAETFTFEEPATPSQGGFGLLVREPVGTVGAIVPWNSPHGLIPHKIGPALLAGCTVVLKMSPEAPGAGYLVAEAAEEMGLPPGVLNVVTADREVSELLVRDPRIDKITFTGSTAAGRKIGAICGERIARMTLELGGKSAAVILDDADIASRGEDARQVGVCDDRPGVLVAHAHRRHSLTARRDGGGPGRELPQGARRRSVRREDPDGPARGPASSATASRATSRRGSTRARRSRPGASGPSTSTAAGSSSRPCSATSTTRRRSPRRRSSGPCSA